MKECWWGVWLLGALLGISLLTAWAMDRVHSPAAEKLEQSADFAMAEDWEQAEQAFRQAKKRWDKVWHLTATVADHTPMEEIDGLFSELEIYFQKRETVHFCAGCVQLSRQIRAMGDAHNPNWWNLL